MNQKLKYVGLLAIAPLFMAALTTYQDANAIELDGNSPHVDVSNVIYKDKGWYKVDMKLFAGDQDLLAGKLLVSSDIASKEIDHFKVFANSVTSERTMIKANDKNSITAEFLKADTDPFLVYKELSPSLRGTNGYDVVIEIHATGKDVTNVQLLVKSDIDEIRLMANGAGLAGIITADTYGITSVFIHAMNPSSITAEILNYQIND